MSSETTPAEVCDNGQHREEEALAVINENAETPAQDVADQTEGAAENNPQETKDEQQDQEQQPQQRTSEGNGDEGGQDGTKSDEKPQQASEGEEKEEGDKEKSKLTENNHQESDIKADNTVSVGTSTVLVETQDVVTSSTMSNQQQRKHSTGRIRSAGRRASYQSSRSYAGGSFQNYGLTYLPYKSNFEPSEDSRRRADEFFKTLKL